MKKEDKKKLIEKIFNRIILILFIGFTALYLSRSTGYYEYEKHKDMVLTNEKIKEFEKDVKDGKNIDITNYIESKNTDYSSNLSKLGLNISNGINDFVNNKLNGFFTFLSKWAPS